MARSGDRRPVDLRPVDLVPNFHGWAEGSCLYSSGRTRVLCTASIDLGVPPFLVGKNKGWLTAEYQMHPRANPVRREPRDGRGKAPSGRTQEIQRLIGRALRAAIDLDSLGERTIALDCDVLEADGGTRTASITGSFVALALALDKLTKRGDLTQNLLVDQIAAVSVGHHQDEVLLDLDYAEDSKARVDLNVVATPKGDVIELQGTAEGRAVPRRTFDEMIDLGLAGVRDLAGKQRAALASAGVDLDALFR